MVLLTKPIVLIFARDPISDIPPNWQLTIINNNINKNKLSSNLNL